MSNEKILLYMAIILVVAFVIIFRPPKRREPSKLKMKDPKRNPSKATRIGGARWVAAENVEDEAIEDEVEQAQWVNPTVQHQGKVLDAYAVLEVTPGTSLEHIRTQSQELLAKTSRPSEKQKIKSAVSAIEKHLID